MKGGGARSSSDEDTIWVGVLRVEVFVRGARTLKDRRQVISSLRDRLRHAMDVTFHEVGDGDDPQRRSIVCTTAGNDRRTIGGILDRCADAFRTHAVAEAGRIDLDVFRWHPSTESWEARMMAELSREDEDG